MLELRPLQKSDGSARFKLGNSCVVAGVFGPRDIKNRGREIFDRAVLDVVVRPRIGIAGPFERELEAHLLRQLDHIVLHQEYPRTQILVVLQIKSTDGSVGAVAGNAAFLALLDAGIAMRATVLSVSIGVRLLSAEEEALAAGSKSGAVLLLDPNEIEETDCDSVVTVSVDSRRQQLVSSLSSGEALDAIAWSGCVEAGSKACKVLEAFFRMSLERRAKDFLQ